MARTTPGTTSTRTHPVADDAGGGGGGGGANAVEWIELPLDTTDPIWTVLGQSAGRTTNVVNGKLEVVCAPGNYRLQGSTNNGLNLVTTLPLMPWANHSGGVPVGVAAHTIQPENVLIKIEVQFDRTFGPINGVAGDGWGNSMVCMAGLQSYAGDQGGSPTVGGTSIEWRGAHVRKNYANEPSTNNSANLYRAGCRTYHTNGLETANYIFSNQLTATPASHDSIMFMAAMPVRTRDTQTATSIAGGGSYCRGERNGPMDGPANGFQDGGTVYSNTSGSVNSNYFHLWVGFGSTVNFSGGSFKIEKIRYCLQPLASRIPV